MQVLINDINLLTEYGITVTKIDGNFNMPARMGNTSYNYSDTDGITAFVEANDIYYKQRKITLNCEMSSNDMELFTINLGAFKQVLFNNEVDIFADNQTYKCILKSGSSVNFHDGTYSDSVNASFVLEFYQIDYEFNGTIPTSNENITDDYFWIDNILLSEFGIVVESTTGQYDFTAMKNDNLTKYRHESETINKRNDRTIKIKCSLFASSLSDLRTKTDNLQALFNQTGLRKLMLPLESVLSPFEVFLKDGIKITSLIINENQYTAQFTLSLIEPDPEIETIELLILKDTDNVPILDTNGDYIYIIGELINNTVYLFTDYENEEPVYLFTDSEFNTSSSDFNLEAEKVFLFTDEETI